MKEKEKVRGRGGIEKKATRSAPVNNVYINFEIERIHEIKISSPYITTVFIFKPTDTGESTS